MLLLQPECWADSLVGARNCFGYGAAERRQVSSKGCAGLVNRRLTSPGLQDGSQRIPGLIGSGYASGTACSSYCGGSSAMVNHGALEPTRYAPSAESLDRQPACPWRRGHRRRRRRANRATSRNGCNAYHGCSRRRNGSACGALRQGCTYPVRSPPQDMPDSSPDPPPLLPRRPRCVAKARLP